MEITENNEKVNEPLEQKQLQKIESKQVSQIDRSLETILQFEQLVDKLENSTIAEQFKEVSYDRDEDGNIIESSKKVIFKKADMVMCLALGAELDIPPMIALSYGKSLNSKAIVKIEKGKKLGIDFATALDQIYVWSSGGRDLVYTSIHIVNAVLNRIGVEQEIIHDGTKQIVEFEHLVSGETTTKQPDNIFIVGRDAVSSPKINELVGAINGKGKEPYIVNRFFKAEIKLTRFRNGKLITISIPYTSQQAIDAGLLKGVTTSGERVDGKDNWNKHTAAHLVKMSIMAGARIIASDALSGIYIPEEITFIKDKKQFDNIEDVEEV